MEKHVEWVLPSIIDSDIDFWSQQFSVPTSTMHALADCESSSDPAAYNPKDPYGGAKGLFQYLQPTWNHYAPIFGLSDIWDPAQQSHLTAYLISIGKIDLWTCGRYESI